LAVAKQPLILGGSVIINLTLKENPKTICGTSKKRPLSRREVYDKGRTTSRKTLRGMVTQTFILKNPEGKWGHRDSKTRGPGRSSRREGASPGRLQGGGSRPWGFITIEGEKNLDT